MLPFYMYNIAKGNKTKNDHLFDVLDEIKKYGFKPKIHCF